MRAKKSLGQNFLMHQQTADRIAGASPIQNEMVLEVGPGTGMLTRALLKEAKKVIAVEADGELVETLHQTFKKELEEGRLVIHHGDIRTFDLSLLPPYHVVSNIPYYITGELVRLFLSSKNKPVSLTFLVQKEVAERVARSKKESLLSLSVKVHGTPKYLFTVPKGAFVPKPKVDSAVLQITDIHSPFSSTKEEVWFFTLLHAGFMHKRKQVLKNLMSVAGEKELLEAFEACSLSKTVRAEDVSLAVWLQLMKHLGSR